MDPILVPVAPPPPAKPTKIFGLPARWVLVTWCFIAILLTPLAFGYVFSYYIYAICIFSPIHGMTYVLTIFFVLKKRIYSVKKMQVLIKEFATFPGGMAVLLAGSGFMDYLRYQKTKAPAKYEEAMMQLAFAPKWILPLTIGLITLAIFPRAINDMQNPSSKVAPEKTKLVRGYEATY